MKWNINFTLLDSDILLAYPLCGLCLLSCWSSPHLSHGFVSPLRWKQNICSLSKSIYYFHSCSPSLWRGVTITRAAGQSLSQLARSDWDVQRSLRVSSSSPGSLCLRLWRSLQILQWLLPGLQLRLPAPGGDWDMRGSMSDFQAITAFHRDSLDYFKCIGT